jgi:hypothetical protein
MTYHNLQIIPITVIYRRNETVRVIISFAIFQLRNRLSVPMAGNEEIFQSLALCR